MNSTIKLSEYKTYALQIRTYSMIC